MFWQKHLMRIYFFNLKKVFKYKSGRMTLQFIHKYAKYLLRMFNLASHDVCIMIFFSPSFIFVVITEIVRCVLDLSVSQALECDPDFSVKFARILLFSVAELMGQ